MVRVDPEPYLQPPPNPQAGYSPGVLPTNPQAGYSAGMSPSNPQAGYAAMPPPPDQKTGLPPTNGPKPMSAPPILTKGKAHKPEEVPVEDTEKEKRVLITNYKTISFQKYKIVPFPRRKNVPPC